MALKTQKNRASVTAFLNAIEDPQQRKDAKAIAKLMREVSGERPAMWGDSIIGYGQYRYENSCGGGEWFLTGFSPRKQNFSLYIMSGFQGRDALLDKLGKHKTGKACLYVKRLSDIDLDVLRELVAASVQAMGTGR